MSDTASAHPASADQKQSAQDAPITSTCSSGVQPRFKRALGFFSGSLFAVAFQGPTTCALLITGATVALGRPAS